MQTTPAPAATLDREFMPLREFAQQSGQELKPLVVDARMGKLPYAWKPRPDSDPPGQVLGGAPAHPAGRVRGAAGRRGG
ncbi:MAG: hypothetical protein IPJ11_13525 [Gemmatimonadetes bacterium]|nr:hypothetical protein [Gemmatimonadota bacterium]